MYVCVQRKRFYKVAIHSRVLVSSLLPFPPRPAAWLCARGCAPCAVTASTKCDLLKFHPFGLSPVGWRWASLLGLLFREQNETQQPQGGQGGRFGLRGLGRGGGLNVLTTLISRGEQNTAFFSPCTGFHHVVLYKVDF